MEHLGTKNKQPLHEISGRNDGRDSLIFPSLDGNDHITLQSVKELLLSFKKEVESYLERLEVGQCYGAGFDDSVG